MSGVVGHTLYAILAGRKAIERRMPVGGLIHRHFGSFLSGAYLGSDIQTLPEAVCVDTGKSVGYGTVVLPRSPLTGGPVVPWNLVHQGAEYRPREIADLFYGRSHLIFGWRGDEKKHTLPWDHLHDYVAVVCEDVIQRYGKGERKLAYIFGWLAHIVGDCLIKSIQPGIDMHLLDGKYTKANRPIQDLVSVHEIGVKELGLDWKRVLGSVSGAPVELSQIHYMRIGQPYGLLGQMHPYVWDPRTEGLLREVLKQNRVYQKVRNPRLLEKYKLTRSNGEWNCDFSLSEIANHLSYSQMVKVAEQANFRSHVDTIAEIICELFEQVFQLSTSLVAVRPAEYEWERMIRRWLVARR